MWFWCVAYVHGTRATGVQVEKRLCMGETIEGAKASYLDIDAENKLAVETKTRLQAQNMPNNDLISTLKDLGIQRLYYILHALQILCCLHNQFFFLLLS